MIARDSVETNTPIHQSRDRIFAAFNMYTSMAHYVGKILHIRPNEILDTWGVPELIVAYGQYANEAAYENYLSWKSMKSKEEPKQPPKYVVKFIGLEELQDG